MFCLKPKSHSVAQDGLKLMAIPLPQTPSAAITDVSHPTHLLCKTKFLF